jgi:aminomethyltransferase
MKQMVLHQKHLHLNAKMTDFQGWQIPQLYRDVQDEYHAVRTSAGLFDLSYLGRIRISGPDAVSFLQQVFTRNIARMAERTAHYGFLCNDAGGILDDSVLFRLSDGQTGPRFLLSTNAMNTDKILAWLAGHATGRVVIQDATRSECQLSLQGPQALTVLDKLLGPNLKKFRSRALREMPALDADVMISRTGYTGEHGYEFVAPAEEAGRLWDALLQSGAELGLLPCGLASRDILRLEMGYLLYGVDIDESRTPIEAGRTSFVDFKKNFIGKPALVAQQEKGGPAQVLAGFLLMDKSVPRMGSSIFSENREIGKVTSCNLSPSLRKGFGMGYVVARYSQSGQEIEIEIRDREVAARIVELPLHRRK